MQECGNDNGAGDAQAIVVSAYGDSQGKQCPRFMVTVAQAIHLLAAAMLARSIDWIRTRTQNTRPLAAIGVSLSGEPIHAEPIQLP